MTHFITSRKCASEISAGARLLDIFETGNATIHTVLSTEIVRERLGLRKYGPPLQRLGLRMEGQIDAFANYPESHVFKVIHE